MKLNYEEVLKKHPWVVARNQDCILSPDSDGLLCGLFMSHFLNWSICGFYDGKVLLVANGVNPKECVFLDMEIYRPNVRSVGQHMVLFDKKNPPKGWGAFDQCISANNLRPYDFKNDFKKKYPFGTIHLLAAIVGTRQKVGIKKNAVSSLLYTDGTFKNQFNYPENCLEWLEFLGAREPHNPLQQVFMDPHYSTYELMVELRSLFADIQRIGGNKRGGDKIKIGKFDDRIRRQAEDFISMLAERIGWTFKRSAWSWGPYTTHQFQKGSIQPGKARYSDLLSKNPLSLAIISRNSIEYTLDTQDVF